MDATPSPLSSQLQALRVHIDERFKEQEARFEARLDAGLNALRMELRLEFRAQLHDAMEKLNARMDSQHRWVIGTQIGILLALVALVANS